MLGYLSRRILFNKPKLLIFNQVFSYQVKVRLKIKEEEYDEFELKYINRIKSYNFDQMHAEGLKYPGNIEGMTRTGIFKFILSHLPKKSEKFTIKYPKTDQNYVSQAEKQMEASPFSATNFNETLIKTNSETEDKKPEIHKKNEDMTIFSEITKNIGENIQIFESKKRILEKIKTERTAPKEKREKEFDSDDNFNVYMYRFLYENILEEGFLHTFSSYFYSKNREIYEQIPYSEHYSPQQILRESKTVKLETLRNTLSTMLTRSKVYGEKMNHGIFNAYTEVPRAFFEIMCLEGEFQMKTYDSLKHLLENIKKQTNIDHFALQSLIKSLSDNVLCLNYMSYFKGAPSNLLKLLWQAMTSLIERIEKDKLIVLLRCLSHWKNHLLFVPANEIEIYEKISIQFVSFLKSDHDYLSLLDLAEIIALFKQSKLISTTVIQQNLALISEKFVEIYSEQLNLKLKDNMNLFSMIISSKGPASTFNLLYLLHAIHFYQISFGAKNFITESIVDHIKKKIIESGLRFYDKIYILRTLSLLMSLGFHIDEKIALEIQYNTKAFKYLTLQEIFLYLEAFKDSKIDPHYIYQTLYQSFSSNIDNLVGSLDYKLVLIIAKIQSFFLKKRVFEQKRNTYVRRFSTVLTLIENGLENIDLKEKVNDLFLLSSLMNPYLNTPDFLFKKILENKAYIRVQKDNKRVIMTFVKDLLNKYEKKFTLFAFISGGDVEYVDKITPESVQIFAILLKKFKALNLLSYNLVCIEILLQKELREGCFETENDRKEFCKFLSEQIIFSCRKISNLDQESLLNFSKFLEFNQEFISESNKLVACEEILIYMTQNKELQKLQFNKILPIIYHLARVLSESQKKAEINKENRENLPENEMFGTKIKQNENISEEQGDQTHYFQDFQDGLGKISLFFQEYIVKKLPENMMKSKSTIIYDQDVQQSFSVNIKSSHFENFAYILPIFSLLRLELSENLVKIIVPQLLRDCINWTDELLMKNLLLLHEKKIKAWEIFEICIENLSTFLIYYYKKEKLVLSPEFPRSQIVELLQAYNSQYSMYFNEFSQQNMQEKPVGKLPLAFLLYQVFEQLTMEEKIGIVRILGKNSENYFLQLERKFQTLDFQGIPQETLLHVYEFLPNSLHNKKLISFFEDYCRKTLALADFSQAKDVKLTLFIRGLSKLKFWKPRFFQPVFADIANNPTYFTSFLEYFSINCVTFEDFTVFLPHISERFAVNYSEIERLSANLLYFAMKLRFPKETEQIKGFFARKTEKPIEFSEKTLKYSSSFTILPRKEQKNTWKVQGNGSSYPEKIDNETIIHASELFSKNSVDNNEFQEDFCAITRYFEQILINSTETSEKIPQNSQKNEEIYANFKKTQEKRLAMLKKSELYGNFLVDFSLTLSLMNIPYKTAHFCPDSSILIDFAVPEKNLAFIFYREPEKVKVFSPNPWKTPDNLMEISREILGKMGWHVFFVDFAEWRLNYSDKEAKEKYFANILAKIKKNEK